MSAFEKLLAEYTAEGANIIPGVILSAINRDEKSIYSKTSGFTSPAPSAPPISFTNTLIIASCTKLLTSIAALQCVERGLISLDDPVTNVLPELSSLQILKPNDGLTKKEEPFLYSQPNSLPTLRQLLTHSAGLGYDIMPPLSAWRKSRGERPVTISPRHSVIESFSAPLLYEPGQGWAYGCGLDWAGLLVARLSGTSLEEYMESNIFTPLGMTSTTFHWENKPHVRDRLVPIQQRMANGKFKLLHPRGPPGPAVDEKGGGGLYSCVPDFMAVLSDLLRETPALLEKEMADMLFSPQFSSESSPLKALEESFPLFASMIGGILAPGGLNYGLGGLLVTEDVEVGEREGGIMKAGTMTWGGAGNLVWFCNRKEGVAGMYASQVFPPGDGKSTELIRAFIGEVWRLAGNKGEAAEESVS